MKKQISIQLPIPYATYDLKYTVVTLRELDETKALILLAIASNRNNRTDTLKDVLHNFYHLNSNYDDFFAQELNYLIQNKTITNKNEKTTLDDYIGNFSIDKKVKQRLDNEEGFFGNDESKQFKSLYLRKGLFTKTSFEEYNPNDKNLIPYTDNECDQFVKLNLDINKTYDKAITIYIENKKIAAHENLFSHEYKNLSDIENSLNLVYLKTVCNFKITIEDSNANIFPSSTLEKEIYDKYYKEKIFYQDLLQLLCDDISTKITDIPLINKLNDSMQFIDETEISINSKELFHNDNQDDKQVYYFNDKELWQLFIYKENITDEINNKAVWSKLYKDVLNIDHIKELINHNLSTNSKFINWIYNNISDKEIKPFILKVICKDNDTVNEYQIIIKQNFNDCYVHLIQNQIDINLIYDLFTNQINNYINKQISTNKEAFLKLLKQKSIANPDLQKIIINNLNFDYTNEKTYLLDSKWEETIIKEIKESKKLINDANSFLSLKNDKDELINLFKNFNNKIDNLKNLNKDLRLTCLDSFLKQLEDKKDDIKNELADNNVDVLTKKARANRDIYEINLPKLLGITYEKNKGITQITNNETVRKILSKEKLQDFKDYQDFNNAFMHGMSDEEKRTYIDDNKFKKAALKLDEYNKFLSDLEAKIIDKEKEGK